MCVNLKSHRQTLDSNSCLFKSNLNYLGPLPGGVIPPAKFPLECSASHTCMTALAWRNLNWMWLPVLAEESKHQRKMYYLLHLYYDFSTKLQEVYIGLPARYWPNPDLHCFSKIVCISICTLLLYVHCICLTLLGSNPNAFGKRCS